jgi:hypothetical protein
MRNKLFGIDALARQPSRARSRHGRRVLRTFGAGVKAGVVTRRGRPAARDVESPGASR